MWIYGRVCGYVDDQVHFPHRRSTCVAVLLSRENDVSPHRPQALLLLLL